MPLVDIVMRPGFQLQLDKMQGVVYVAPDVTQTLIKYHFSRALPDLIVAHARDLGIDPTEPSDGVQVMHHDYGPHDTNTVGMWIKIQFLQSAPEEWMRREISSKLHEIVRNWFTLQGAILGDDYFIDVLWIPASGIGIINGKAIHY